MLLSLIRSWFIPKAPKVLDLPGHGVVDCGRCHKYLRTGFALSLMTHLEQEHKMHEDLAIHTATHMLDLMLAHRTKSREQRNES